MPEPHDTVTFDVKNYIARVVIDNPPANLLNPVTMDALGKAVEALRENDSVRVIIITGQGEKFFVGGQDITVLKAFNQETGKASDQGWHEVFGKIHHSPKIVIAAINGLAVGGGCELALACDLRIAAENAGLVLPEVNCGVIPGAGGTQRLARIAGVGFTKELIFTGDMISAQEAFRMGIVNRVVPAKALMNEARLLAEKILSKAPIALRLAKEAINLTMELPLSEGLKREVEFFSRTCGTEDKNEGTRAFLEKRPPHFKGK